MSATVEMAREVIYALDPVAFATDRLRFKPDDWQARVLATPRRQVLLNCSRQAGKSSVTAILATHTAIYRPGSLVLVVSPSQRQSGELFAKITAALRQADVALENDNALSCRLASGSRIVSLPGDPATIRGYSAPALVVVDEAAFVDDALYDSVRPMLAVSGGRLALMSTPYGQRGFFHAEWTSGGDDWHRERVPAHLCPRISAEFLAEELRTRGAWIYAQEYGCEFVTTGDQLLAPELIAGMFTPDVEPLRLTVLA